MPRVEIYTRTFCGYCVRATHLLESKGVAFEEYVIDADGSKRNEMIQRANGRTTVPQIFVGDRHLGGCSELLALERSGDLNALLGS